MNNKSNILTLDEFILSRYCPPSIDSDDYLFYSQWGYEQYLIKTFHYDLDGIRILVLPEYQRYCMVEFFSDCLDNDGNGVITKIEEKIRGFPIIKTVRLINVFLAKNIPKDQIGIVLFECNNSKFC